MNSRVPGTISPPFRQLLRQVQIAASVAVEVMDAGLNSASSFDHERWPGLREDVTEVLGGETARSVLAAGRDGQFDGSRYFIAAFPVRVSGNVRYFLLVARPLDASEQAAATTTTLIALGQGIRSAMEAEIDSSERARSQREKLQRLNAATRLAAHLHAARSVDELFDTLLQSAAVWHDIDARVYHRSLSGTYQLRSQLPGADLAFVPAELHGDLPTAGRALWVSSMPELQRLGWTVSAGEVLLIPVGLSDPAPWLLVLVGHIDSDVEQAFTFLSRLVGHVLEQFDAIETSAAQHRVCDAMTKGNLRASERDRSVLREAAACATADGGLLLLCASPEQSSVQVLASVGEEPPDAAADPVPSSPILSDRHIAFPLELCGGRKAVLHLWSAASGFTAGTRRSIEALAVVLASWLSGRAEVAPIVEIRSWSPRSVLVPDSLTGQAVE